MKIGIGSKSDKKINAIKKALEYVKVDNYELYPFKVESEVDDNPFNEDTLKGAHNRNQNIKKLFANYDMLISIEAGFTSENGNYYLDTYCVVEYQNQEYIGLSPRLKISKTVYDYVKAGNVLHLKVQELQRTNTDDGVIGFLSCGNLTRTAVESLCVEDALIKALGLTVTKHQIDIDNYLDQERQKYLDEEITKTINI